MASKLEGGGGVRPLWPYFCGFLKLDFRWRLFKIHNYVVTADKWKELANRQVYRGVFRGKGGIGTTSPPQLVGANFPPQIFKKETRGVKVLWEREKKENLAKLLSSLQITFCNLKGKRGAEHFRGTKKINTFRISIRCGDGNIQVIL